MTFSVAFLHRLGCPLLPFYIRGHALLLQHDGPSGKAPTAAVAFMAGGYTFVASASTDVCVQLPRSHPYHHMIRFVDPGVPALSTRQSDDRWRVLLPVRGLILGP